MKKFFGFVIPLALQLPVSGIAYAALQDFYKPSASGLYAQNTPQGVMIFAVCRVSSGIFAVLMAISVIMVLWAAYNYLTSSGDEEKIKKATRTITYAAVAIVVALIATGFPFVIASFTGTTLAPGCSVWRT
mgnify:CR=1 FL=1